MPVPSPTAPEEGQRRFPGDFRRMDAARVEILGEEVLACIVEDLHPKILAEGGQPVGDRLALAAGDRRVELAVEEKDGSAELPGEVERRAARAGLHRKARDPLRVERHAGRDVLRVAAGGQKRL